MGGGKWYMVLQRKQKQQRYDYRFIPRIQSERYQVGVVYRSPPSIVTSVARSARVETGRRISEPLRVGRFAPRMARRRWLQNNLRPTISLIGVPTEECVHFFESSPLK
jgi:hypothetical protein